MVCSSIFTEVCTVAVSQDIDLHSFACSQGIKSSHGLLSEFQSAFPLNLVVCFLVAVD